MTTTERDYLSGLLTYAEYVAHMLARYGAAYCRAHAHELVAPVPCEGEDVRPLAA